MNQIHIGKPNPILGEIRGIIEKQEPKIIEYFLEYGTLQGFRFDRLGQRTLDKLESILVSVSKLDISVEEMEEKYREKHQNNGRHPRDYDTRYRTAKGFKGRPKSTRSYDNH